MKPPPQLGCGMGGITGLFIYKVPSSSDSPMSQVFSGHYSLVKAINCAVAAMVSLCAGCNLFPPWASCLVAAVGAAAYLLLSAIILALRSLLLPASPPGSMTPWTPSPATAPAVSSASWRCPSSWR